MSAAEDQVEQQWRVSHRGKDYGCFAQSALRAQILAGKIAPDAQLSREGYSDTPISVADFLGTQRMQPVEPAEPMESSEAEGPFVLDMVEEKPPSKVEKSHNYRPPHKPVAAADPVDPAEAAGDTQMGMASPSAASPTTHRLGPLWWQSTPVDGAARDRIVVLGRRQSGKTIYLATLYAMLWNRLSGLAARASTGAGHRQLMSVANMLKGGAWPPATQGTMELPLEVEFGGMKQAMVALDFAGELFTKAFFRDQAEAREVTQLVQHLDRAAAVILLVDPMVTMGLDREAVMEDDFGLVNAVRRIRQSPGGEEVPVVFVLTKADVHADVVGNAGGLVEFVRRHFASLARLLGQLQIYQVSAVQTETGSDGQVVPRGDSTPFNIDKPLLYCMQMILRQQKEQEERLRREAAWQAHQQAQAEEEKVQRRQNRKLRLALILIFLAGLIAVAVIYIVYYVMPPARPS